MGEFRSRAGGMVVLLTGIGSRIGGVGGGCGELGGTGHGESK